MASTSAPVAERRLHGNLGAIAIVFMVIAAASPLTVVGGAAPLGIALGNGVGFPALFLAIGVVLLLFAVGFAAMTRVIDRPGAFYTYVTEGLGKGPGTGAAWLALVCYTSIQIAVHAFLGFLISQTIADLGGPAVPWWACSLAVVLGVGLLGYRHIDLSSKVLGVLLVAEILVVVVIVIATVATGGAEGLSAQPFEPAVAASGAPGVGLLFAIAAYIGFEATAIYRDEARDPDRTIPRATYGALIGVTLFYAIGTWGLVMAWGPSRVVEVALSNPSLMLQSTAGLYFGEAGPIVVNVLLMTSMLACVLSFHNVLSRYVLSMSKAGLLPARLSGVHARHASPHRASIVQSVAAAALLAVAAIAGLDPVLQVFGWLSGVGTLAVVLLMLGTSIAAIVYFARRRTVAAEAGRWRTAIAPTLGAIGLLALGALLSSNFPSLVGDVDASGAPTFSLLSVALIGLCVVAIVGGIVQHAVLRSRGAANTIPVSTIGADRA